MPMMETEVRMIDLYHPELVEVQISPDRKEIWVNVNGICRLRAKAVENMVLDIPPEF